MIKKEINDPAIILIIGVTVPVHRIKFISFEFFIGSKKSSFIIFALWASSACVQNDSHRLERTPSNELTTPSPLGPQCPAWPSSVQGRSSSVQTARRLLLGPKLNCLRFSRMVCIMSVSSWRYSISQLLIRVQNNRSIWNFCISINRPPNVLKFSGNIFGFVLKTTAKFY